jgi:hypothetical protein
MVLSRLDGINFYYVDVLGLNAGVAGILWSIYGLWNAINDPLMGQKKWMTQPSLLPHHPSQNEQRKSKAC